MAINPFTEQVLPFSQVPRRLPSIRAGRAVNPSTIWRWASHGVRGVKLEVVKIGGTTCTSLEALRRFFARLDDKPEPPIAPAPTPDQRADHTAAALEAFGI